MITLWPRLETGNGSARPLGEPEDQEPGESGVVVAGRDGAGADRAEEALEDPHPVLEEVEEEDERGGAVGGDEEGEEVVVVLVDVPAQGIGHDDAVPEAGDRERLRDPLQGSQNDRL